MKNLIIEGKQYHKPLFVFALKAEAGHEFDGADTVFTGIGKVNAVYHLLKGISLYQPDIVINLGTAGSSRFERGQVVCCTDFYQRDMEVTALGFGKFETPFSHEPALLRYGIEIPNVPKGICGSGDSFEMEHSNPEYNVIDMEAFALAKVCEREKIPFLCLKYISDGADGNAVSDWNEEIRKASAKLFEALVS